MQSNREAEYPGIVRDEEELRFDFWMQTRLTEKSKTKKRNSTLLARIPPVFFLKNPECVRREEETGGLEVESEVEEKEEIDRG